MTYSSQIPATIGTISSSGTVNIPDITRFQAVVVNKFQVLLRWGVSEAVGQSYDINNFSFTVLRSHSDSGEFEEATVEMDGITEYLDQPQSLFSMWRRIFYKLRVKHKQSNEVSEFGPISIHENTVPSAHGAEIIRRHALLLEKYPVGALMYAFPQRQWGSRCYCWSPVRSRPSNDNHETCMGTGWIYPYSSVPVKFYGSLNPTNEILQIADYEVELDDRHFWTINYPDLKKRDAVLIPGLNNSLYRVHHKKWIASERAEVGILQLVHLTPIDPSEPEQKTLNLSGNLQDVRDYMDVVWNNSRKTYFGSRDECQTPSTTRVVSNVK